MGVLYGKVRGPSVKYSLLALLAAFLAETTFSRLQAQAVSQAPQVSAVQDPAIGADATDRGLPRTLNPLSTLDVENLSAFKGRPLFAPARRPPAVQQVYTPLPPVAMATPVPDLRLVGVVAGVDKAVAILRRNATGPTLNVKVGDAVDTWRVHTITPDRVVLREGEREQTYRLFTAGRSSSSIR